MYQYHFTIEEAIRDGCDFYFDEEKMEEGRSGGTICPKCRKWTSPQRKRKHHQPTWIRDCETCEIKEPFKRMWHKFNKICDEDERQLHNKWLVDVKLLVQDLYAIEEKDRKMKLHKLICEIPFFEGV